MEWLAQNWFLLLIVGAFAWMMFGRGAGGCCGGGVKEPDAGRPADANIRTRTADRQQK